jgi:hypothetical protein
MSWFSTLASVAVPVLGTVLGTRANNQAAERTAEGATQAAAINADAQGAARQEYREAANRGIRAINAGTDQAIGTIRPMLYVPPRMTDAQRSGLDDLTRSGNAQLAASGLRGAGRAGVSAVMDQRRRFIQSATAENEGVARDARSRIASIKAGRGAAIAGTETGLGSQIGGSLGQQGQVTAGATRTAADASAGAGLANANLTGSALGTIGAIIADEMKSTRSDPYGSYSRPDV